MQIAATLAPLGFTETESLLYCELLRRSPRTGYDLAKTIGKAVANTYQALAGLTLRGAVLIDEGATRLYRPVPPAELMAAAKRRFETALGDAAGELAKIHVPPRDDHIYQIRSVPQLYERAFGMIEAAREILLFDLFEAPFAALRAHLDAAAARGVTLAGLVYSPPEPPPAFPCFVPSAAPGLDGKWPGAQLTLVADGREHLVALLSDDGERVLHGVWSDSNYLSCLQHSGLASEIRLLETRPLEDDRLAHLALLRSCPSGLRALLGPADPLEETQ
jgi:hypothetical protein